MKFGLFTHIPWPEGAEPQQLIEEVTQQAICGEELGFDSIWLAEHHFTRYGLGSSSLIIASSIAARTKKIRLGTAVLVPPLHNPVRLAEGLDLRDSQIQPFPLIQWAAMHLLVHLLNQLDESLGQLLFMVILHTTTIVRLQ